jgi:hypothetical protein
LCRAQVQVLRLQIRELEAEVSSRSGELRSLERGYRSEVSTGAAQHAFTRYKSMRDHSGRFFLSLKIC